MNSYFPVLNHLFQTKKGHPEALLSVMSSMACALFRSSCSRETFRHMTNHEDLGHCFTDLDEKLRELMETTVPSNVTLCP